MADRFPLILNTSTNQIQEIPSGDSLDLTGSGIANAGIITAGNVTIGAATTDLLVNGDARVTGILTVGTGSLTLDGPNNLVNVGTALTLGHTQGLQFHTQNLHSAGFEVNQINVSGASTMGDDVTFNGASSKNMVWDSSDGDLEFADNARLKFGNGDDFFLYHNGSHSYIKNSTNYLYYLATQHHFKNAANNELQARFQENGPVELYHDNTKRFETTTSGVTITGDGTFTGNVSIGGTLTYEDVTNIDSVGIITARSGINLTGGNITLGDTSDGSSDDLLIFGAGSDLKIYHDSNHSYIQNATGDLFIKSNADDLVLQAADDVLIRPQNGEDGIKVIGNGAVELYHDNSKKFETTSAGNQIFGNLVCGTVTLSGGGVQIQDNDKFICGNGDDLQIYHSGSHSYIADEGTGELIISGSRVQLMNAARSGKGLDFVEGSSGYVRLYHNNTIKLETTSGGATVTGNVFVTGNFRGDDNSKLDLGNSNDLQIYHDGANSLIDDAGTGILGLRSENGINFYKRSNNEFMLKAIPDGAVELYYNNVKKLATTANGIKLNDDTRIGLGDGEDLQIYHNNSSNTNEFRSALSTNFRGKNLYFYTNHNNSSESSIMAYANGAVELYYDNTKKFATTSTGCQVANISNNGGLLLSGTGNNTGIQFTSTGGSPNNGYRLSYHSVAASRYGDEYIAFDVTDNSGNYSDHICGFTNDGLHFPDNKKIHLGGTAANGDLQIYHDGSNSFIRDLGTGSLQLDTNGTKIQLFADGTSSKTMANFIKEGAVELYYNNAKHFETTSFGAETVYSSNGGDIPIFKVLHGNRSQGIGLAYNTVAAIGTNTNVELNLESQGTLPIRLRRDNNTNMLEAYPGGEVRLYHNGEETAVTYNTNGRKALLVGDKAHINNSVTHGELIVRKNLVSPQNAAITQCARMTIITNEQTGGGNGYGGAVFFGGQDVNASNQYCTDYAAIGSTMDNVDLGNATPVAQLNFWTRNGGTFSEKFRIYGNGTLEATDTSIGSLSDERLKKNIKTFEYDLENFKALKPKTFNWIKPEYHTDTPLSGAHRGFIAQDIEKVDPELISEGTLSPDSKERELVGEDAIAKTAILGRKDAMYVSVIQQLIDKIEKLEKEVASLKNHK